MERLDTPRKPFPEKYGLLAVNLNKVPDQEEVVAVAFPADPIAITVIFPDEQETRTCESGSSSTSQAHQARREQLSSFERSWGHTESPLLG
jgi:hypothetical protein